MALHLGFPLRWLCWRAASVLLPKSTQHFSGLDRSRLCDPQSDEQGVQSVGNRIGSDGATKVIKTINCSLDHRRHDMAVVLDQQCDYGAAGAGRVPERLGIGAADHERAAKRSRLETELERAICDHPKLE